jgi:lambda family phage tail tape measure protein
MDDEVSVSISADTRPFRDALENLKGLSAGFGAQLTGALRSAAVSGRSLDDVLRRIATNLAGMALSQGLAPLNALVSPLLSNLVGGLARAIPFAKGGVPGRITPFAAGGIVNAPTFFPMAGATGLMGEAGAEAILPLARGGDGRLGVVSGGGGSVNVTFNVTTPDAASFRRSEAQITGMLARAVSRGSRTL